MMVLPEGPQHHWRCTSTVSLSLAGTREYDVVCTAWQLHRETVQVHATRLCARALVNRSHTIAYK